MAQATSLVALPLALGTQAHAQAAADAAGSTSSDAPVQVAAADTASSDTAAPGAGIADIVVTPPSARPISSAPQSRSACSARRRYVMDRKDSQVDISSIQSTATGNFNNLVTINANGTTKIRGVEADVAINPVEGLTLNASYAYTYTKIPLVPITWTNPVPIAPTAANPNTINSMTVNQRFHIVFTPRNAASAAIDYDLPIGSADTHLHFHLDANYSQAT